MKISMIIVYQYMAVFFYSSPTSNHLHALQVENCDSNSRLVVDEMTMENSGMKGLTVNTPDKRQFRTGPDYLHETFPHN